MPYLANFVKFAENAQPVGLVTVLGDEVGGV
jgi:hypothetical protein